ncbi:type II toxin-antitoxin system TacA family antitoxin [Legionella spiritensis]|uniref:DUF1778 domain-containing protein n=1 Tax=Legionella spiritensis TaxID=452 RepID=A0A0W0Z7Z7_LEGSP|nr:DUF1778 domain-containing protein [Legionella spiritensis]KTD65227.1 hypothetical protein Lspi_0767 [Legionella spiritensis]SNV31314.1 Uncharacterized protein conserved in bacteria [Legionella spiritensis]
MEPIKQNDNTSHTKKGRAPARARSQSGKSSRIGLRISPAQERAIKLASEIKGKSTSEFILDTACQAAEQTLLDQRLFMVSNENFEKFSKLLDRPPMDNEGLKKLFSKPSPWDE